MGGGTPQKTGIDDGSSEYLTAGGGGRWNSYKKRLLEKDIQMGTTLALGGRTPQGDSGLVSPKTYDSELYRSRIRIRLGDHLLVRLGNGILKEKQVKTNSPVKHSG